MFAGKCEKASGYLKVGMLLTLVVVLLIMPIFWSLIMGDGSAQPKGIGYP